MSRAQFDQDGYLVFEPEPALAPWCDAALGALGDILNDPAQAYQWQCEGTWFVGVDALSNAADGSFQGVAFEGAARRFAESLSGPLPLHPAQVSVARPGYPKPRAGESEAAFGYRLRRDAAHVDGLLPSGPDRRRKLGEPHAWILGICLTDADASAAPLVVWPGSHRIMGQGLSAQITRNPKALPEHVDLTDTYTALRREVFENCPRKEVPLRPGQAIVLHRHVLHGIAPWGDLARADARGRATAYFRPEMPNGSPDWLWLS